MKVYIGAGAGIGYVHTITCSAAKMYDIEGSPKLFQEDDNARYGYSVYLGIVKRNEVKNDPNLGKIVF